MVDIIYKITTLQVIFYYFIGGYFMELEKYINDKYDGNIYDFLQDECEDYWHRQRIQDILDNREYLAGNHKIKQRVDEVYNGKIFETRRLLYNMQRHYYPFETAFY